jgi:hypothetical protein
MSHSHSSPCGSCTACCGSLTRRGLLSVSAAAAAPPAVFAAPERKLPVSPVRKTLRVQPVLIYQIFKRREQTSWRPWGGLFTEKEVGEEKIRIQNELAALAKTEHQVEFLPLREARNVQEAAEAGKGEHDVLLLYPASGGAQILEAAAKDNPWTLVFVRHRSGPVYEWYEIVHPRFLRKTADPWGQDNVSINDVVVDEQADLAMRIRALAGLKNTVGKKMVCVGGPSGWGAGGRKAPDLARRIWKFDLVDVSYDEIGERLKKARADESRVRQAKADAAEYLSRKNTKLETRREFVENAFIVNSVFLDLMAEHQTDAMTINNCMSKIMPISETTACLPLSLLNDAGLQAYCESDFVVIPSGVLLNAISAKPVFLNDPTYPHHGVVTLAHCTAPRKMDGKVEEPVRILTHFESDYGAAPKVEMRKGQKLTNIVPDFDMKKYVGFKGEVVANPFMPICRSQIDVGILGSERKLVEEMRGFHWMTGYGDYLAEVGYALGKLGIGWLNTSERT